MVDQKDPRVGNEQGVELACRLWLGGGLTSLTGGPLCSGCHQDN